MEDLNMSKIKMLGKYDKFILCVENDRHYFIKGVTEQYVDMSGTKENLLNQLKKWKNEIDFNNEYMKRVEEHFITILEN